MKNHMLRLVDGLLSRLSTRPSILPAQVERREPRPRELRRPIPMEYLAQGPSRVMWLRVNSVH